MWNHSRAKLESWVQYCGVYVLLWQVDERNALWMKNKAGLSHSHQHGFGLMSAWRMVNTARVRSILSLHFLTVVTLWFFIYNKAVYQINSTFYHFDITNIQNPRKHLVLSLYRLGQVWTKQKICSLFFIMSIKFAILNISKSSFFSLHCFSA